MDESGLPLEGAAIRIEDSRTGTFTDAKGEFLIKTSDNISRIEVSFLGMKTKTQHLNNKAYYKIVLQEDNVLLSDFVTTGYQIISKE